ncbi:DNA polymerase subunit gamma-1-like [Mercenaria mercenaria]|uniref:DNA polymerase subunit gamma-1-like n=1 Tax=Mercenaria mercenaria TaxID=6596 RepID=UPI00234EE71F|nr:DNA polymerase subunit gamma-1-like [Mercenaria mercenaria]
MSWCKLHAIRRGLSTSCSLNVDRPRVNEINIQLLSESLQQQIFGNKQCRQSQEISTVDNTGQEIYVSQERTLDEKKLEKVKKHLSDHELWNKQIVLQKDINFDLPPLLGKTIDEHFINLGRKQVQDYVELSDCLCTSGIPEMPNEWAFCPGWVKYDEEGIPIPVDYPEDCVLVFDVETVVQEGNYPAMATAVSDKYWYSWCSDNLVADKFRWTSDVRLQELIPLETTAGSSRTDDSTSRLVIGHNVAFDRSYVKEQYYLKKSKLRFMDTMSMHIAVCGLTNIQRTLYQAAKNDSKQKIVKEYKQRHKWGAVVVEDWKEMSSLNNLADVHQLHVGGGKINKDPRNIFVEGSTADVRDNFQELMNYCAGDVRATYEVFRVLWPEFNERFPHPVTLSGMLEMATGYLPINQNWERYKHQSNVVYNDMERESKQLLMRLANDACEQVNNESYKKDPWLWDLDWTTKPFKLKKEKKLTKKQQQELEKRKEDGELEVESCLEHVLKQQERHYKTNTYMSGYPEWYRTLCSRVTSEEWCPGPHKISHQTRVTPKLLRLTWDGFPIHFDDTHGWGYLVPGRTDNLKDPVLGPGEEPSPERLFPYKELCEIMHLEEEKCVDVDDDEADDQQDIDMTDKEFEVKMDKMLSGVVGNKAGRKSYKHHKEMEDAVIKPLKKRKPRKQPRHKGDGPHNSVNIPGCWFFKIPHKDGKGKRVGNPLAKDYLNRVEDGTLSAHSGPGADMVLKLNKASSYWKMNHKRIESQMSVWFTEEELSEHIKKAPNFVEGSHLGAIVPRIVPAGTITRRGVEPTWLTASNAYVDRIGSELKSMIQAPPGFCFVGADVDSQELWIGAVLGDSHFGQTHGCTALGWMTLQGSKKEGTDLHSVVADKVSISRDHAKVFNYGRIYGAGQRFAQKLLQQFNHRLTVEEARQKAQIMFSTTKGKRSQETGEWSGGSESSMFNKLEEIAHGEEPCTPVLGCRISKALEPENVNEDFMTSRINWVVQSSAVDYLHLMLTCMHWLFEEYNINGRFSISIHDEVRYLVAEEDCYRAALALQITNLLTRAIFSYKLGLKDLPLSVAFFSAIDIDQCLRKEVNLDCVTPSNPHGLEKGYQIPQGFALDIYQILEKTRGCLDKDVTKMEKEIKDYDDTGLVMNSDDAVLGHSDEDETVAGSGQI